ncbi:MAG: ATP-dependent Clp protease proteolytic subunit [Phycisphaerales bacterium]|nr:ATP-dependent Clp protease proteolytic subunit [Phycisphaerales bacterium]
MPNWKEVLDQIKAAGSPYDIYRRSSLAELHAHTDRNVIIYYSGWLQKPALAQACFTGFELNDSDKNGFMAAIHHLDRSKGLDLVLHTPGGDLAACESLVDYLRLMFRGNIRAIVPQLAMSAGTMVACACERIVMGKHSSLGSIDPQFGGIAAHGVIEEFERARKDISDNPANIPIWQPILAKYPPTFVGECEKAIAWSTEIVKEWLLSGMLRDRKDKRKVANKIVSELGDHALMKSHARHISAAAAEKMGLEIFHLESSPALQNLVLTLHHICIQTLAATTAIKLIENHLGMAFIQNAQANMPSLPMPVQAVGQHIELPEEPVPQHRPSRRGGRRSKRSRS